VIRSSQFAAIPLPGLRIEHRFYIVWHSERRFTDDVESFGTACHGRMACEEAWASAREGCAVAFSSTSRDDSLEAASIGVLQMVCSASRIQFASQRCLPSNDLRMQLAA